jgi:hypothetical protein
MKAQGRELSSTHFAAAGVMTSLSLLFGIPYLMLGLSVPRLSPSPLILLTLGVAAGSVLFSLVQSIRWIGFHQRAGWAMLLGNCFYAVVLAPIVTIHVLVAVEAMK